MLPILKSFCTFARCHADTNQYFSTCDMKHHTLISIALLATAILFSTSSDAAKQQQLDSLLRVLDKEIAHSQIYLNQRVEQINELKTRYYANPTDELAFSIAELYAPYLCDSALRYYQLASVLADGAVPKHIEIGLHNCQTRMYGGESVYEMHYRGAIPPVDTHEYAIYAYRQSDNERNNGNRTLQQLWLVKSAIADVRSGVTDNASSWMLAEIVYDNGQGDIQRAYNYVQYSLNNAAIFDARLRFVQINQVSQIINQAYEQQRQQAARRLYCALAILAVVLLCAIMLTTIVIWQNKRLHTMNQKMKNINHSLHEANNIKERYISLYLVAYADNLRQMAKMAPKANGMTPAQFLEKEMPAFYRHFDDSFLSIYPDFVDEFNALLKPDKRIYPEQQNALNTELRIFALIRLGIDSSTQIAKLLCYSANTIYNYRARVKNCAVSDREGFEDRVRKIGTFTE